MDLPQQDTINQYLGDLSTTEFDFTYLIQLDTDIDVYVTPAGSPPVPSADIKILGVDYTVEINPDPLAGGTVIFVSAPAANSVITLSRNIQASIDTAYSDATNFNGANLDNDFERVTLVAQQNKTFLDQRAIRYAVNSYLPDQTIQENNTVLPLLTNIANQIWKSQGEGIIATVLEENPDVGTLRTDLANNALGTDGSRIVGYFDDSEGGMGATTVHAFLANLINQITTIFPYFKPGMIIDWGGVIAPTGFFICDGSAVSRITYVNLLNAITFTLSGILNATTTVSGLSTTTNMYVGMSVEGNNIPAATTIASIVNGTTITLNNSALGSGSSSLRFFSFGSGDGSTTFNIPDYRDRSPVGAGGTGSAALGHVPGQSGGEKTHTLTTAEVPNLNVSTSHGVRTGSPTGPGDIVCATGAVQSPITLTGSTTNGGGGAHNNIPPSLVANRIIKY